LLIPRKHVNMVIHRLYCPEHRGIVFLRKFDNHVPDYRAPWPGRQRTMKTSMKTQVLRIIFHGLCLSGIMWVVKLGARKNKGPWTIFRDSWGKDVFQFLEPLQREMARLKAKAEFTQRFQARSQPCGT